MLVCNTNNSYIIQCESKIPPPCGLVAISPKRLGIFQPNFTCPICVPIYARLQIFIQFICNYAILSATTQFISCVQDVQHRLKCTLAFSDIFPKQLGIFSPNFTCLLNVHMHAKIQIFIQLSPTGTKLCHIKCDHPARVSVDGGHFEYIIWWSRLIWHNFIKVADNWIKICSPAYIGTYNRCVKLGLKIPNRLGKMSENFRGGFFSDSQCTCTSLLSLHCVTVWYYPVCIASAVQLNIWMLLYFQNFRMKHERIEKLLINREKFENIIM